MYRPLWAEVNLEALRYNFSAIKKRTGPEVKIMAVLKQEAYGHGLIPVAKELSSMGVDFFGLGSLEEAVTLRKNKFKEPILILSSVPRQYAEAFIEYNVVPTVVNLEFAQRLDREAKKRGIIASAHVKIDTGMGRLGVWHKESISFIKEVSKLKNISLEGVWTHFPSADTDRKFTLRQIKIFNSLIGELKKEDITFKYLHCANSIGIVNYKDAHFNMVRPGIILYGIKPSRLNINLKPVLSLKSKVIFTKSVSKGRSVGYGRAFTAGRNVNIATVSVGYADGYPWQLSNKSKVIIRGRLFNIAGRVCMDHIMVNLGEYAKAEVGDEVILIGESGKVKITAENLAKWAGTIPYEIVSRLSSRIPRFYKKSTVDGG